VQGLVLVAYLLYIHAYIIEVKRRVSRMLYAPEGATENVNKLLRKVIKDLRYYGSGVNIVRMIK
jgi:hypothetical protein